MDLVATVSQKETVDVWRYNGQRVFWLAAEEDETRQVEGLAWKADGKMLAVSLSGGTVLLIDSFSGKVAYHLQTRAASTTRPPDWSSRQSGASADAVDHPSLSICWQSHFVNAMQTRQQLAEVQPSVQLDDLLGLNSDIDALLKAKAKLPRELAKVETDVALPKLSTLPATGADDDIFSTRHSIDTIFHARNTESSGSRGNSDLVDTILTHVRGCVLHVSIFDSFIVGAVDLGQALPKGLKGIQVVHDASHPLLSAHHVIVLADPDGPITSNAAAKSMHLLSLDLRFINQASYNLPLLVTKATQLQNLLRYLSQVSDQLSAEIRTAFDLPSRFVENINETLAEEDQNANFMTEAYRLIVTGTCDSKFRDWLVDQVGDRGLKRWEKAVGDCLDMIRRMTSECLIPAVERAQIVVSRLDGLARFTDTASRLGLDEKAVRDIRDALDTLNIHCEDMLRDVCTEIREFAAFMRWLKWETEVQTLGEDSERAEEMRETYAGEPEIRVVLDYIESAMKKSRLVKYISADSKREPSEAIMQDSDLLATYKKARNTEKDVALPKLSDLVHIVRHRSDGVFQSIAETLRKNILVAYIAELPRFTAVDSRITTGGDNRSFSLHLIGQPLEKPAELMHMAFDVDVTSRRPSQLVKSNNIELPEGRSGKIWGVKAAGNDGILALVSDEGTGDRDILWRPWTANSDLWQIRHKFEDGAMGSGMSAGGILVNERKGKRGAVVTDEEDMGFVVLELDSSR